MSKDNGESYTHFWCTENHQNRMEAHLVEAYLDLQPSKYDRLERNLATYLRWYSERQSGMTGKNSKTEGLFTDQSKGNVIISSTQSINLQ